MHAIMDPCPPAALAIMCNHGCMTRGPACAYALPTELAPPHHHAFPLILCRDFRHEKTKKKRGSYKGGAIDPHATFSIKFADSDDE